AEPSLPMAWPPGMTPLVRVETRETLDDDAGDSELVPKPDPGTPRLFTQGHEAQDSGGTGDRSNRRQEMGSPQEINDVQSSDAAEPSASQWEEEEPVSEAGDESEAQSSKWEPEGQAHSREAQGTTEAASALDDPAGQSTDQRLATPHGAHALEPSDVMPGGSGEGAGPSEASGGAGGPPNRNSSIVDVPTGESASAPGAGAQPGPDRAAAEAGVLDAGAPTGAGAG